MTDRLEIRQDTTTAQRLALLKRGGRMTKFKGQVASFAPSCLAIDLGPATQAASTIALAAGMLMAPLTVSGTAMAGGCYSTAPDTYVCSGPAVPGLDSTSAPFGFSSLTVSTQLGFGHDTRFTSGDAISLATLDPGPISFSDLNGSVIQGHERGLDIDSGPGAGPVTVVSNGSIVGYNNDGINIVSQTGSFISPPVQGRLIGVDVDVHDVSGGTGPVPSPNADGIEITNTGPYGVSVSSTGTVSGHRDGIKVTAGGGVVISGVNVNAQTGTAIDAAAGTYDLQGVSVTTTGLVQSTSGAGIKATTDYGTVTLNVNAVTANTQAIYASAGAAGGDMSVTATGQVTGGSGGVHVKNMTGGGAMTLSFAGVSTGSGTAVNIDQNASRNLQFQATGAITSNTWAGIDVDATNAGGGNVTLTFAGVQSAKDAVNVSKAGSGNVQVITSGAVSSGVGAGVTVSHSGSGFGDTYVSLAGVQAATEGVSINHTTTGQVTLKSTGNITSNTTKGVVVAAGSATTGVALTLTGVTAQNAAIDVNNAGSGNTQVTATGTVASSLGQGVEVVSGASTTGTTLTFGAVTGHSDGIYASHLGSGALSVTASGSVLGSSGYGVMTQNTSLGSDVTVNSTNVQGYLDGIKIVNNGTGNTYTKSTGTVTGGSGYAGISTLSGVNTGTTTVIANHVYGSHGINSRHYGSGDLSITTSGTVSGSAGSGITSFNAGDAANIVTSTGTVNGSQYGINAVNDSHASGTDLKIYSNNVSGGNGGIFAANYGSGQTVVSSTGTVQDTGASAENGINVFSETGSTSTTINVNNVSGRQAINATHRGTEGVSITATGSVSGTTDSAIWSNNANGGATTITTSGAVNAQFYGIYAKNDSAGEDMTISTAAVSGGRDGIKAQNDGTGSTSVTATGAILGGGMNSGIRFNGAGTTGSINVANVTGGSGIRASHRGSGDFNLTASGAITGQTGTGIDLSKGGSGAASIDVQTVTAHSDGIYAYGGSGTTGMTVSALDVSSSYSSGVVVNNYGTGTSAVTVTDVTAAKDGIRAKSYENGSSISVTSTGEIEAGAGSDYSGITSYGDRYSQNVTIAANDVSGGTGVFVNHRGYGDVSITTTGDVEGAAKQGIKATTTSGLKLPKAISPVASMAILAPSAGAMTIEANNVTAYGTAIEATHAGTGDLSITATGDVIGTTGSGVVASTSLSPYLLAPLAAYAGTPPPPPSTALTINANNITAAGNGVYASHAGAGDLTITTTGQVTGQHYGVYAYNYGGSDVHVTVNTVDAALDDGVSTINRHGGETHITATGTVNSQGGDGISARGSDGITIEAVDVQGSESGVFAFSSDSGDIDITTTGTVTATAYAGIIGANFTPGGKINIDANNVTGGAVGIAAYNNGNGSVSITTSGTVTATSGVGISVESIEAVAAATKTRASLALAKASPPTTVKITSGTVTGATSGIVVNTTGDAEIDVTGKVTGQGGTAIDLQNVNGASQVTLSDGWGLDGKVLASTSGTSDKFILAGSNASTLDLGLFGNAGSANGIVGFDSLSVTDGSNWNLTGSIAAGGLRNADVTDGVANFNGSSMVLASGGLFTIGTNGTLSARGTSRIGGGLSNAGAIDMVDGAADDRLEVTGDYTGAGGNLAIDVDFATDTADTLVVGGNVEGDTTEIEINAISPTRAAANDILVVDVTGTTDANDFALAAGDQIAIGVLTYGLDLQGTQWFLTSDGVTATGLAYQAAPSALLAGFSSSSTLRQRIGSRSWEVTDANPTWLRIHRTQSSADSKGGASPYSADTTNWGLQAGADFAKLATDHGRWVFGAFAEHNTVNSTVTNDADVGTISGNGFGLGLTATYYGNNGFYADAVGRIGKVNADISSSTNGALLTNQDVKTAAFSLEAGYQLALAGGGVLTPQAQLSWGRVNMGTGTDHLSRAVDFGSDTHLEGRFGMTFEFSDLLSTSADNYDLYVSGNILRDFSDPTSVSVDGVQLLGGNDDTQVEVGLGGSYAWSENASIFGEGTYRKAVGGGSAEGFNLTLGAAINW
ncbi:autotransporter outer membrane beta-barrel domain-containing protein [Aliiroseovarius lamellibrachiae]|uniref:autotransporter outer membrane beta-barrel domain-containing protein n=1 Tax=Aliiroseovarius lamellibrachiae TaxID=1924933 RepID=UPI001BE083BE|nr:autotransporter outer membrane beta-barrel domain-containing protein [Aliiroseovarius lamellibrachiae]MBT2130640.1 autotransporter outer membrane beta-barrel domain-containing protein [Aliiroseovarius lamellibrachiae]